MKYSIAILLVALSSLSHGAKISVHDLQYAKEISIEGRIENGDFEYFVNAVIESGPNVITVHLASNGGNAIVAMNIGQFIRNLKFTTNAPNYFQLQYDDVNRVPPDAVRCLHLAEKENCTCLSSCALIYFSGIQRSGNYVGIHRTYLEHEYLRNLSMSEAATYTRAINSRLEEYLGSMGIPSALREIMESIPSNEIKLLDKYYIDRHLREYAKDIQEWLSAKCGYDLNVDSGAYESLGEEARKALTEKSIEIFSCKYKLMNEQKQKSYKGALKEALKSVNVKYVKKGSNLDKLISNTK